VGAAPRFEPDSCDLPAETSVRSSVVTGGARDREHAALVELLTTRGARPVLTQKLRMRDEDRLIAGTHHEGQALMNRRVGILARRLVEYAQRAAPGVER
jgi:hypothetical protein